MDKKVYAFDFDNTLFKTDYPIIGRPIIEIIDFAKKIQAAGNIIILWTCRSDNYLIEAITACASLGLIFNYVNENTPENIALYGGDSRKICADYYIDDKNMTLAEIKVQNIRHGGYVIYNHKEDWYLETSQTTTQDISKAAVFDDEERAFSARDCLMKLLNIPNDFTIIGILDK